ncbi:hypothetical protein CYK37_18170 [Mesorhizobium loti]|nr:hypothetical protein CYK37_18170 [Mesorhizobium loti]
MDQFRLLLSAFLVVGITTTVAAFVAGWAPNLRPLLLQEDGIVEMATAIFFALAALGAATSVTMWGLRLPLLLAGLIGFAELMDETSFGSRLFGFQPPPLYGGGQLDGFHDLLIVAFRLTHDLNPLLAWLLVGLLLAASVALIAFVGMQLLKGFRGDPKRLSTHTLLFAHFAFIGLAQVIDISASSSHALSAMEEVFELDAAILLAFYVLQHNWEAWIANRGRVVAP